ncbi:MAG: hypothetical protein Q9160_005117 [Pyrenula sp. 1 TL-2023]
MDSETAAAIAALIVAILAMTVALAQAIQQYFVTGQLIRMCDSVVYGKMPGQGRRISRYALPCGRNVVLAISRIREDICQFLNSNIQKKKIQSTLERHSMATFLYDNANARGLRFQEKLRGFHFVAPFSMLVAMISYMS